MIAAILLLFVGTFAGGLLANFLAVKQSTIRYPLIFAGSFLFAITIIHILPEVFTLSDNPMQLGVFVLAGFFFQQILEILTAGVEHGHFHVHNGSRKSVLFVIVGLSVHSILEGALLTHDSPFHGQHESNSLLIGILLHKIPAAFALAAILKGKGKLQPAHLVILTVFSVMSPLGLILSDAILDIPKDYFLMLFAFVSGSFLHISTTIFVETSPDHKFKPGRILVSIVGALVAIAAEYLM
jgi:zinc transporter ZupT